MEGPALGGVGGLVIDLLALPAADDQPAVFELAQVVGDGRAAHPHDGGEVDDALLTVAQQPEDAHAAAVAQQLKQVGDDLKVLLLRHGLRLLFQRLSVPVR